MNKVNCPYNPLTSSAIRSYAKLGTYSASRRALS